MTNCPVTILGQKIKFGLIEILSETIVMSLFVDLKNYFHKSCLDEVYFSQVLKEILSSEIHKLNVKFQPWLMLKQLWTTDRMMQP